MLRAELMPGRLASMLLEEPLLGSRELMPRPFTVKMSDLKRVRYSCGCRDDGASDV